jgi:putative transposase
MYSFYRGKRSQNSLRYPGRDYSRPGKYFVTICTANKTEWFGKIINSEMQLSEIGSIAFRLWCEIPIHFPYITLDEFIIMPNHLHGIVIINKYFAWQSRFYDTIICTTGQLSRIRKYIKNNPRDWM